MLSIDFALARDVTLFVAGAVAWHFSYARIAVVLAGAKAELNIFKSAATATAAELQKPLAAIAAAATTLASPPVAPAATVTVSPPVAPVATLTVTPPAALTVAPPAPTTPPAGPA